jgi:hypothetical protein
VTDLIPITAGTIVNAAGTSLVFGRVTRVLRDPKLGTLYEVRVLLEGDSFGKTIRVSWREVTASPLLYQLAGAIEDGL